MNLVAFRVQFPEFRLVDDSQVQAFLDAAALEMDSLVWNELSDGLVDQGHGYLAAHKLTMSPFGQGARLAAKDGTTTYGKHYDRLVGIATCGVLRVT